MLGLLAEGESVIEYPLVSSDTMSCVNMIRQFGADVKEDNNQWRVTGKGGELDVPEDVVDIGNSGTSLYIGLGLASLVSGYSVFTGDHQIRSRPAEALMRSITDLKGEAFSTRNNGMPPVVIKGRIKGGKTKIEAVTSQYLTSLLLSTPFAEGDTVIDVPLLYEKPYVTMTLGWLDKLGIKYKNNDYKSFEVNGGQSCTSFREYVAADFSSGTFFLAAAAITGAELTLNGLDFNDTQGDKEVVTILKSMGASVEVGEKLIKIQGGKLKGGVFDLNAMPDSLPALSVAACFAEGETRLINVPQARLKETDRIKVMCHELKKMGAHIEELEDGLVIRKSELKGAEVNGHDDHRVVMALSVAGLMADGETVIQSAESVSVTFPGFLKLMKSINADINKSEE